MAATTEDLDRRSALLGVATTLAVAVPVLAEQVAGDVGELVRSPGWWWTAYLVFVLVLVADVQDWPRPFTLAQQRLALAVMTVGGLVAVALSPAYGFSVVLPIVTASAAAFILGLRPALVLVAFQAIVIAAVYLAVPQVSTAEALLQGAAWAGFMGFAVFTVETAARQGRARARLARLNDDLATANDELARANVELEEAQRQLALSSRNAERLRISRDLHDLIGHQLTALSLQLETASHRGAGPATHNVDRAREIARDLLGDVRAVVGRLREDAATGTAPADPPARVGVGGESDLARSLRDAIQTVAPLAVDLDLDDAVLPVDGERAVVVLRVVQEVVTNTARHAGADHLWIRIGRRDGCLVVAAHDDGRGVAALTPGHGLVGMEERLAELGGTLATWTPPGRGLHLEATIPTPVGTS